MINCIIKFYIRILFFFNKIKHREIKSKIDEVINSHELLIKEYELIKQKKSKLPATKRREIESQIIYLIAKGHIIINQ